jgi:hypothetical protein
MLEIVEFYQELAIEAVHALAMTSEQDFGTDVVIAEPRLVTRDGSRPGPTKPGATGPSRRSGRAGVIPGRRGRLPPLRQVRVDPARIVPALR